jgi:hypothetical protein
MLINNYQTIHIILQTYIFGPMTEVEYSYINRREVLGVGKLSDSTAATDHEFEG